MTPQLIKKAIRASEGISGNSAVSFEQFQSFILKNGQDLKVWEDSNVPDTHYIEIDTGSGNRIARFTRSLSVLENIDRKSEIRELLAHIIV